MKTLILGLLSLCLSCQKVSSSHSRLVIEKSTEDRSPAQVEEPKSEDKELSTTEEFMQLVNDHRQSLGLGTLTYSEDIETTAFIHSRRMARKFIPFGHMGSKLRCQTVLSILELDEGALCGENVAMGQEDAKSVFKAWMESESHRQAIEDGRYTHSGLGFYKDFRGRIYWTQIFVDAN